MKNDRDNCDFVTIATCKSFKPEQIFTQFLAHTHTEKHTNSQQYGFMVARKMKIEMQRI